MVSPCFFFCAFRPACRASRAHRPAPARFSPCVPAVLHHGRSRRSSSISSITLLTFCSVACSPAVRARASLRCATAVLRDEDHGEPPIAPQADDSCSQKKGRGEVPATPGVVRRSTRPRRANCPGNECGAPSNAPTRSSARLRTAYLILLAFGRTREWLDVLGDLLRALEALCGHPLAALSGVRAPRSSSASASASSGFVTCASNPASSARARSSAAP